MRFDYIKIKNMGPFKDAELDLQEISGRIVAVAGDNGSGKSTLLELMAAGLYRSTPTRGKLTDLATSRDSFVTVHTFNSSNINCTHTVDSVSSKGESFVMVDGAQAFDDGKVRSFDKWSKENMPAPDVFYTSTFAAQGSGGFLELKPGDRKAVLLRTLGVENLEKLAEAARSKVSEAKNEMKVVDARLEELRHIPHPYQIEDHIKEITDKAIEYQHLVDQHTKEVSYLELNEAWRYKIKQLLDRREDLLRQLGSVHERIHSINETLKDSGKIREASDRVYELDTVMSRLKSQTDDIAKRLSTCKHNMDIVVNCIASNKSVVLSTEYDIEQCNLELKDSTIVQAAVKDLEKLNAATEHTFNELNKLTHELETLQMSIGSNAFDRIVDLREGLMMVVDETVLAEAHILAIECLADDDVAEANAMLFQDKIDDLTNKIEAANKAYQESLGRLIECRQVASRMENINRAYSISKNLNKRLDSAKRDGIVFASNMEEYSKEHNKLFDEHKSSCYELKKLENERNKLASLAKKMQEVATSRSVLHELETQSNSIEKRIADVGKSIECLGLEPYAKKSAREDLRAAEKEMIKCNTRLDFLKKELSNAQEANERIVDLTCKKNALCEKIEDYTRLAKDLGRNGLQAMEVDAAGPELTELANDLLHTCLGTRWTVSIETQRNSADGKKTIEGCDVRVIDTLRGRDASAESLSGGERVLVSEAISLALSMLATRRAGIKGATIVRDETGASLDPKAAVSYVSMLRRAAELVDASHVLFVSHNPEARDIADAIVWVKNGRIEVTQ